MARYELSLICLLLFCPLIADDDISCKNAFTWSLSTKRYTPKWYDLPVKGQQAEDITANGLSLENDL